MRYKFFLSGFFCLVLIILCEKNSHAYSTDVHEKITVQLIKQNAQNLNYYLKSIGLTNGTEELVSKKRVREWLQYGSWMEDYNWLTFIDPLYSHFYDPLTNKSGVGDIWFSAYDWANAYNNQYSWKEARNSLYYGLTTKSKYGKEASLSKVFTKGDIG